MRPLRRHALGLGLLAAACSGPPPPEAGVATPPTAFGRVRVQVTSSVGAAEVVVSSRFVAYRGVDRATADLLTGGDAPVAYGCAPAPAPAPLDDLVALIPDAAQGHVEHLDAGEITAVVDGVAIGESALARPALAPYVGGMEYDDQAARIPVVRGDVIVTSSGGVRVGPFEVATSLPPAIDARATWGADLAVAWAPVGADEVVVTVAPERGAQAVVCRAPDRGELHVRPDLLGRVAGVASGTPVTVVVDRVRHAPLAAPGLADGSLEVVARDVITASAP